MKTGRERNKWDQRHVEFTITLLGCTVIKARSPWRERRLQACPVSSLAPLISSVSPTETYRQTFRKGSFYCTGSPIGSKESAKQAQIVVARAPQFRGRRSALDELPPGSWRSFFDVLMKISCAFLKVSCYTWTCHPLRLGKKRIFGKWFSRKFQQKRGWKVKIILLNLHQSPQGALSSFDWSAYSFRKIDNQNLVDWKPGKKRDRKRKCHSQS